MNLIIFQFETIAIHILPGKDICFIYQYGRPIWCGDRDKLIKILESVHDGKANL